MPVWSAEIKEIRNLAESIHGRYPDLEKELKPLLTTDDANVVMLYSRRCLEVIITELCEVELKRPRKTEPLKGIIDKLNSENKIPSHIITSMHSLNSLSTYGTHPKDFEVEQVKPVLVNLLVIIRWFIKYKESLIKSSSEPFAGKETDAIKSPETKSYKKQKKILLASLLIVIISASIYFISKTNLFNKEIEKSIAVLPFRNDSPEDSTQYFMVGVMEELLNKLQSIRSFRVIGRTSVERFRDQNKSIQEIAKELGVNYIVEGSGQKSGNTLRMRVQLLKARNERHIWGNSFEQENLNMGEYFKAQTGFAEAIANELNAAISSEERELIEKTHSIDLEVYDNYLKASQYWGDVGKESLQKALDYLNSAIKEAPNWAPLYSGLAQTWLGMQQGGFAEPSVAIPEIYKNLNKAIELDPNLSEAHYLKGMIAHLVEWDLDKSEKEFLEALAVNPNDAQARALYAQLLCVLQRADEGATQGRLALKIDPLNPYVKVWVAGVLLCVDECQTAIRLAEEITADDPENYLANQAIWIGGYNCKEYEKVIKAEKYNLQAFNVSKDGLNEIERIFREQGFIKAYERIIVHMEKFAENNPIQPIEMAMRYVMADQADKAMDWLEKGLEWHDPTITYVATRIFNFESLFDNSRFLSIVRKANIPPPSEIL